MEFLGPCECSVAAMLYCKSNYDRAPFNDVYNVGWFGSRHLTSSWKEWSSASVVRFGFPTDAVPCHLIGADIPRMPGKKGDYVAVFAPPTDVCMLRCGACGKYGHRQWRCKENDIIRWSG